MTIFYSLNRLIRDSEASLVNLLSAVAPWLAPLAPAYLTYSHLTNAAFSFPTYIALSVAAVVEVLGLSSVSTVLAFRAHNKRYKDEKRKAPVWVALFSFVVYLLIILVINVVLDAALLAGSGLRYDAAVIFAKALLTLLSVPAAVILAVRTQHKEVLDEIDEQRQQRKAARSAPRATPSNGRVRERLYSTGKLKFLTDVGNGKLQAHLEENATTLTPGAVSSIYGTSERNARRWIDAARERELI